MEPWFLPAVIDHLVLGFKMAVDRPIKVESDDPFTPCLVAVNNVATFLVDVYGVDVFFLPEVPVSSNV